VQETAIAAFILVSISRKRDSLSNLRRLKLVNMMNELERRDPGVAVILIDWTMVG